MPYDQPILPTGQELYDRLMGQFEPELTTEGVKLIRDRYKNETPDELRARKKRYLRAIELYEHAYQGYMATLSEQVDRYRRGTIGQVEIDDRKNEEKILSTLLSHFSPA
jgi:hypothetical protein